LKNVNDPLVPIEAVTLVLVFWVAPACLTSAREHTVVLTIRRRHWLT
jgi:hypothetical protein